MKFLLIAGLAESLINFRGPLIVALQRNGFDVHVAAPNLYSDTLLLDRFRAMGVHVHEIPLRRTGMNVVSDLRSLFALILLMIRLRPTYVLAYTIKPVVYGSLAAWVARVPKRFAMITGLGYAFQGEQGRTGLRKLVENLYALALSCVDKVFFQNPDDKSLFVRKGILKKGIPAVVVNGSGVDISTFKAVPLPQEGMVFLFIARLLGDKGVREYVDAARRVKGRYPNSRFLVVGWIDENPDSVRPAELESWVNSGVIEFLGRLSDVRPAIEMCNVYVLPSYREGTPRTVLEAMAMGRPVITTDAPGCRETVVDEENGFLVQVKSVDALEHAMLKFFQNPDLIPRMGAVSRLIAESKYDVDKVNAIMLSEMGVSGVSIS